MAKEAAVRIPEDSVEAEDNLVEVAVAEALDGLHLPVRKRRIEDDVVDEPLRILGDRLLEYAKGQGAQNGVALERRGVSLASRLQTFFSPRH